MSTSGASGAHVDGGFRICCVMGCDAGFFHQAKQCIATLKRCLDAITGVSIELGFVAIDLTGEQREWLALQGVKAWDRVDELPLFANAPRHAYALTCRPYLPAIFPGYDGYVWVDCDVRFLDPSGLFRFVQPLGVPQTAISIVQETEPAYGVNNNPQLAYWYHSEWVRRLAELYPESLVDKVRYFTPFNAGLFAARADSPIWVRYRHHLQLALDARYDAMREQDALNIAIVETGNVAFLPSWCNWLCSLATPVRHPDGSWRNPWDEDRKIAVAHLTNSGAIIPGSGGKPLTFYEYYKQIGITA